MLQAARVVGEQAWGSLRGLKVSREHPVLAGIPLRIACIPFMSRVPTTRLRQPMMVYRHAHRDRGVQVDAQDLGYRAELLFDLGL